MKLGTNIKCDFCGTDLYGRVGTAWISKENMCIKGSVSMNMAKDNDYFYVGRDPLAEMHYCNIDCFKDMIEFRRNEHESRSHHTRLGEMKKQAEQSVVIEGVSRPTRSLTVPPAPAPKRP